MRWVGLLLFSLFLRGLSHEVALTFDDVPMPRGELFDAEGRIHRLLDQLEERGVQAAFFCIGASASTESGRRSLEALSGRGQLLANHSFSHRHASKLDTAAFLEELKWTDLLLQNFTTARRWFRFPYLDYGNREGGGNFKKAQLFNLLRASGYTHGYATINSFDWYINGLLQKALRAGYEVDYGRLKTVYLDLLEQWTADYGLYWSRVAPEEPHVLLLHANDLNALYLTDLIDSFESRGWTFVSPDRAYANPRYHFTTLSDLYVKLFGLPIALPPSLTTAYIDKCLTDILIHKADTSCAVQQTPLSLSESGCGASR